MKKILALMCAMFFAGCTINLNVPPTNAAPVQSQFDVKQAHKSVASIYVKQIKGVLELSGTAFAIDKEHLVTAGHVCVAIVELQDMGLVEENIRLSIVRDGVKSYEDGVEILEIDEPHDVCLVKKKNHGLIPVEFVENYDRDVKFNDKVWIVGAPLGFMVSFQEGYVMDTESEKRIPVKGKLIVSAAAAGGNSGSPVLNEEGKVVGILVMGPNGFDHLSICVTATTAKRFLRLAGWPKD